MGKPKITGFMIGIVLVSLFAGVFALLLSNLTQNYGGSYDEDDIEAYNKLSEMATLTEDVKDSTNIDEKSGILDIIGEYFSKGYQSLRLTVQSFDTFDTIANKGIEDANLGAVGEYLRITIGAIIIVLIFVGVIIAAIVKMDI